MFFKIFLSIFLFNYIIYICVFNIHVYIFVVNTYLQFVYNLHIFYCIYSVTYYIYFMTISKLYKRDLCRKKIFTDITIIYNRIFLRGINFVARRVSRLKIRENKISSETRVDV